MRPVSGTDGTVVIVGGGILGTMHAWHALGHGLEVVHLEKDPAPRSASVRNFGLVWVGGRAAGPELQLALRARELWAEIAGQVDGMSLRPSGSVTVALDEAEVQLMKEAAASADAPRRGWELLDAEDARSANPALSGAVVGGLLCTMDAVVEPRLVLGSLNGHLIGRPGYRWLPGRSAVELAAGSVRDDRGDWFHGDQVFVCTGASHGGLIGQYLQPGKVRRVRLQMMQTEPYPGTITTALADADSMRYYPAFDLPGRASLPPQDPVAARWRAQLLLVQRTDGCLTIGDTHHYDEPFAFDLDEAPYEHLLERARTLLAGPVPPVRHRWAGVYSEVLPPAEGGESPLYWRQEILPDVELVTGPGGRGMTCSPAIAEESLDRLLRG